MYVYELQYGLVANKTKRASWRTYIYFYFAEIDDWFCALLKASIAVAARVMVAHSPDQKLDPFKMFYIYFVSQ